MASIVATATNQGHVTPGPIATPQETDPELVEHFDNFALNEVIAHDESDIRTRLMVQLAALIACQAQSQTASPSTLP